MEEGGGSEGGGGFWFWFLRAVRYWQAAAGVHPGRLTLRPPPPPPRSDVWCVRPPCVPCAPCAPAGARRAPRCVVSCGATLWWACATTRWALGCVMGRSRGAAQPSAAAAVCCSLLQSAAVNCSPLQSSAVSCSHQQAAAVCCCQLQAAVACCCPQPAAVSCCLLQSAAFCCSQLHLLCPSPVPNLGTFGALLSQRCSAVAAVFALQSLRLCPSPVTNHGTIGALLSQRCSLLVTVVAAAPAAFLMLQTPLTAAYPRPVTN